MSKKKTRRRERSKKLRVTTKVRSTGKEDQKQHGKRRNEKKAKKIEKKVHLSPNESWQKMALRKKEVVTGHCGYFRWGLLSFFSARESNYAGLLH